MKIEIISDSYSPQEYNKAAHHPLQAWEWGEARKETGIEVIRVGEFEEETLRNVFQLTIHTIPQTAWAIGYLPRSVSPSKEVLEFLKQIGKEHKLIFIKLEPYVTKQESGSLAHFDTVKTSPHPLFPNWTQQLDISPSEEDLLTKMKSKTRYNIRLAGRKGVVIKEQSNEEGFETFIKLYFETCKRQKYYGHSRKYHEIIWNNLKNGIAHILIAYYNNTPLSAYELFLFKDTLYYPYGGSSVEHRDVMASNLLMWEAIKLGKLHGAVTFDMWGSLPPDSDNNASEWGGFTRFKEGYGTEYVEFIGSFDLVMNSPLYSLYNVAHTMRKKFLDFKTNFVK